MIAVELLLAALLAGAAPGPSKVDVAAERAALFRADKEWSEAASRKDVEKVLSFWTDDATVYPPGQPAVVGKEALRRYVTGGFALPGFAIAWQTSSFEVAVAGDMAFGVGTNIVSMTDPEGKPITERGRAVTVWRKEKDGRWRCVIDVWNGGPDAPLPAN